MSVSDDDATTPVEGDLNQRKDSPNNDTEGQERSKCQKYWGIAKPIIVTLLLGQILSLALCGTGVATQLLSGHPYNFKAPLMQTFIVYVALATIFGPILACREDFLSILKYNWWKYLIVGTIDAEANFLAVLAYQYTTLTSIQLLDSFATFTVLVLSFLVLKMRYRIVNLVGIGVCLIGIACTVLADLYKPSTVTEEGSLAIGDILALSGALLYGTSNVVQEFLVKNHSIVEFLAGLGLGGSLVTGIQMSVLERDVLAAVYWDYRLVLLLILFATCLLSLALLMPIVMKRSSAILVNLSLLTADVYALLFGLFLFKLSFPWLYILAFVLVVGGLIVYNLRPPVTMEKYVHQYLWEKLNMCYVRVRLKSLI